MKNKTLSIRCVLVSFAMIAVPSISIAGASYTDFDPGAVPIPMGNGEVFTAEVGYSSGWCGNGAQLWVSGNCTSPQSGNRKTASCSTEAKVTATVTMGQGNGVCTITYGWDDAAGEGGVQNPITVDQTETVKLKSVAKPTVKPSRSSMGEPDYTLTVAGYSTNFNYLSGGAPSYTSTTTSVCTVNATNGTVHNVAAGECIISFSTAAAGNFVASPVTYTGWNVYPKQDQDNDTIIDYYDNCDVTANTDQADQDADLIGNVCDADRDGDGVLNVTDNCPTVSNATQIDSNGYGVGDACWALTPDLDGDGILNAADNCPHIANALQENFDGDSKGDVCDPDKDGDTVLNDKDNCPITPNTPQDDSNLDSVGDACERKFVSVSGDDVYDCSSWQAACKTIQRGIDMAVTDGLKQVFIAKGVYRPASTIQLKKGISLYGGFSGAATDLSQSSADPSNNLTIISGDTDADNLNQDSNGMVWSTADLNAADINTPDLATLLSASVASTLEADNITLYGLILNAANGTANGGALIVNNSRVELIATRIIANMAANGGGIYMSGAAIVNMTSTEFKANKAASAATNHGGAIYNTVSSPGEVNIINSLFTGNSATGVGGAIYKPNTATMSLNNVRLEKNSSASWGGAIAHARGILNITNGSVFDSNTAVSLGGAIRVVAGTTLSAILNVDTTEFNNNYSDSRGGAIDFTSTTSANEAHKISNNLFLLNRSKVSGGAIDVSITVSTGSTIDLVNNTFYQNYAGTKVDGTASGSVGHGGAINIYTGNLGLVNANYNTMVANQSKYSAGLGGAIYVDSANKLTLSRSLIAGNLASNGANVYLNAAATDGGYNLLGFNAISGVAGSSALANVTNIIPTAAQAPTLDKIVESMVSFDGGDGYYAKLRTLPVAGGSSGFARDAIPAGSCGTVVTDTRGEKRPDAKASKCDIGAYEFTVLTCQQDAQRRYNQGEVFVKVCSPQTENMELALGNIGYMGLMLLILMFSYRERQTLIKQA